MSAGKGSARRPGKPGAYERGYKRIKWYKRSMSDLMEDCARTVKGNVQNLIHDIIAENYSIEKGARHEPKQRAR